MVSWSVRLQSFSSAHMYMCDYVGAQVYKMYVSVYMWWV